MVGVGGGKLYSAAGALARNHISKHIPFSDSGHCNLGHADSLELVERKPVLTSSLASSPLDLAGLCLGLSPGCLLTRSGGLSHLPYFTGQGGWLYARPSSQWLLGKRQGNLPRAL
jgi:hypothetical protein